VLLVAEGIGFQCLQRRRGRLIQRFVELLEGGQRFAQLATKLCGRLAEGVYPSSVKDLLKKFNKDSSFSTSNAVLGEAFILLVGGKGGSGG
jgi:hypothetical protein